MNPLDDQELLLWSMQAGLTRAEVRQSVRRGRDAGHLAGPGANETAADRLGRIYVGVEAVPVVAGVGDSSLELMKWPTGLAEDFQVCDIVER